MEDRFFLWKLRTLNQKSKIYCSTLYPEEIFQFKDLLHNMLVFYGFKVKNLTRHKTFCILLAYAV